MKLSDLVKSINSKKGVVRCIDENGIVYSELTTDGISIDFVDAPVCIKQGEMVAPKTVYRFKY